MVMDGRNGWLIGTDEDLARVHLPMQDLLPMEDARQDHCCWCPYRLFLRKGFSECWFDDEVLGKKIVSEAKLDRILVIGMESITGSSYTQPVGRHLFNFSSSDKSLKSIEGSVALPFLLKQGRLREGGYLFSANDVAEYDMFNAQQAK